jgi:Domain of unknown function (DUF4115)
LLGNAGDADRVLRAYARYLDVDVAAVTAEKPKPSQERPPSQRRTARALSLLLWIAVGTTLVVALAYVVGITLRNGADGSSGNRQRVSRPAAPTTIPNPSTTPKRKARSPRRSARKSPAQPPVRLVLTAARGGSWVEARAGSRTGAVLFSGTLTDGRRLRLSGRRLWVRFGAASNLAFMLNGRRAGEELYGTVETLVTPQGIRRT